jgi:hypothetical protein
VTSDDAPLQDPVLNWSSATREPTPELAALASYLATVVSKVVRARDVISRGGSPWEAVRQAWALSNLMVRNIEAVLLLAQQSEAHVTAAWGNTRIAFEQSVRIIWLLYPADPFVSECRWLTYLAEAEKFHRLLAEECAIRDPEAASAHRASEEALREARRTIAERLPAGYAPPPGVPSVIAMMKEFAVEEMYRYYREGSQYVHGAWHGASAYRRHVGDAGEFGDFTALADWALPLRLCWLSLRESMALLFFRHESSHIDDAHWSVLSRDVDVRFREFAEYVVSASR